MVKSAKNDSQNVEWELQPKSLAPRFLLGRVHIILR